MVACLKYTDEAGAEQLVWLVGQGARVTIGRRDDMTIRAVDASVDRRHGEVLAADGRFFVRDYGTTNGTEVDGSLFTGAEREVRDGGEVRFGARFVLGLSVEKSSPLLRPLLMDGLRISRLDRVIAFLPDARDGESRIYCHEFDNSEQQWRFLKAISRADIVIPGFDWMGWREGRGLDNPEAVSSMNLLELRKLFTAIVRDQRMSGSCLYSLRSTGLVSAMLSRLLGIRDARLAEVLSRVGDPRQRDLAGRLFDLAVAAARQDGLAPEPLPSRIAIPGCEVRLPRDQDSTPALCSQLGELVLALDPRGAACHAVGLEPGFQAVIDRRGDPWLITVERLPGPSGFSAEMP